MHGKKYSGFTLLELLVYIPLVTALLTVVWTSCAYEMKSMGEHAALIQMHSTQEFIRYKLSAAMLGATNVHTLATSVSFDRPDMGANSPLQFFLEDGTLLLSRGQAGAVPLTLPDDVGVMENASVFYVDSATGALNVQFMLQGKAVHMAIYK